MASDLITRRGLLAGAASFAAIGTSPALAELVIDLRKGSFQPMPIAITDFSGDNGGLVAGVLA
ncbi:MAG: Tol-Pal system protein TolB, partial [Bosea sp. (in: a-proteobacteria)]